MSRLSSRVIWILLVLLVFSLGQANHFAPAQNINHVRLADVSGMSVTAEGVLDIIYADPRTPGAGGGIFYSLSLDNGTRIPLVFSGQPPPFTYFQKRVVVTGRVLEGAQPSNPTQLQGSSALTVVEIAHATGQEELHGASVIGTRKVIMLLLRFSDDTDVPHPADFYDKLINPTAPQPAYNIPGTVNGFYVSSSWNQFHWIADVTPWFTLPFPRSHYVPDCGSPFCADLDSVSNDGTALGVAAGWYFPQYDNINFVVSNDLDCCAWGGGWWGTLNGVYKGYGATWEPPWGQNAVTYAHEMGHSLGLPHSGWVYWAYDSPWDVMSSAFGINSVQCGTYPYYLSCSAPGDDITGPYKEYLGWIDASHRTVLTTSSSSTVTLDGLSLPLGLPQKLVKICITGSPCSGNSAHYFTAEARVQSGNDAGIPGEGVIINMFEADRASQGGKCFGDFAGGGWAWPIDSTPGDYDSTNCNAGSRSYPQYALYNAQWQVGQAYVNTTYSFRIDIVSSTSTSFTIHVNPLGKGWVSGAVVATVPFSGALSNGPHVGDESTTSTSFTPSGEAVTVTASGSQQYFLIATSQLWNSVGSIGASMGICRDVSLISGDMYSSGPIITHRHLATAIAIDTPSAGSHTYSLCFKTDPQGTGWISGGVIVLVPTSGATSNGPHVGDESTTSTSFTPSGEAVTVTASGSQQYLAIATSQEWNRIQTIGASIGVCRDGSIISGDMYSAGAMITHRDLATATAIDTPSSAEHTYSLCFKTDPGGTGWVSGGVIAVVPVNGNGAQSSGPHAGDYSATSSTFVTGPESVTVSPTISQQYLVLATSQEWDSLSSIGVSIGACRDGSLISGDMYSSGPIITHRHLATAIAIDTVTGSHKYSICFKTDYGMASGFSANHGSFLAFQGSLSGWLEGRMYYCNALGENVDVFLFARDSNGNLVGSSPGMSAVNQQCGFVQGGWLGLSPGTYTVTWEAYRASDFSLTTPIDSSTPSETQTLTIS